MNKRQRTVRLLIFVGFALLFLAASILTGGGEDEPVQEVMRDAVLHESARVSLFGRMEVNPGLISAFLVTGLILLEQGVGLFDSLAKGNSPHRNRFLGAYVFTAGVYIFISTLFELLGLQAPTTAGGSVSLPAPLSDINGAIALGCLSYGVILSGGIAGNGLKGVGKTLKDFSLPVSMSFRLFGALLSGALVTELVYYYINLSFVLPVIVGVLFTLLHALIQAYVLTMLTTLFYGEVSEPPHEKAQTEENRL